MRQYSKPVRDLLARIVPFNSLKVECPYCKCGIGRKCHTQTGAIIDGVHFARLKAANRKPVS
ncbi:MAG: zinc finger domain-containing protein [Terriglobales bacterium]